MADRPDKSGFERWAGLHFDLMRSEIWADDADGNRERAPVFQAVIDVMRCIPFSPEREDETQVGAWNICSAAMFAGMEDQPNLRQNRGGTAADLEELQRAHNLLFDLAGHLFQMHRDSRGALEKQDPSGLQEFQSEVARWSDRAHEAWSELDKTEHRVPCGGAPTKEVKAAIRPVALQAFELLTGRPAARKDPDSNPLADFFRDLFGALGLPQRGAANQARIALKERPACTGENPP